MTLTDTLEYINQALNYPALTFNDISLFFNSSISELNTTLHTSIPTVSRMIEEFRQYSSNTKYRVVISSDPQVNDSIAVDPAGPTKEAYPYYYDSSECMFKIWDESSQAYISKSTMIGMYLRSNVPEYYIPMIFTSSTVKWIAYDPDNLECELGDYLPDDWIILWVIPYVCYKYTLRDGGTAQSFSEEMQQGFQQLQETYDVPSKVYLPMYADKEAYYFEVTKRLPNIAVNVPCRAIYEDMKHSRTMNNIYGSMYDRGGFYDDQTHYYHY